MKIHKLTKKLVFKVLENQYIIRFLVKIKLNYVIYFFGLLLIKSDKTNSINEKKKYNFLCLDRPIFNEDIASLASASDEFKFIKIPKEYFLFLIKALCTYKAFAHQSYYSKSLDSKSYKVYKKTILYIIKKIIRKFDIKGILTGNYNYSWQQEIALFCSTEKEIKFVIILKEGLNILGVEGEDNLISTVKCFKRFTNNRFIGDMLFVYNDLIKDALIKSNIKGISQEKIIVSGIPRMDKYYNLPVTHKKEITFFSFSIEDKTNHLNLNAGDFNKTKILSDKYHLDIIKFAILNKEYKLTIKTKANKRYIDEIRKLIRRNKLQITSNIHITNKGQAYDLIKNSSLIIGFNSVTLQESLAAERKVICCDFRKTKIKDQFEGYENIVYYFDNYEKLEKLIKTKNIKNISSSNKKKYLEKTLGNTSGSASKKILKELKEKI